MYGSQFDAQLLLARRVESQAFQYSSEPFTAGQRADEEDHYSMKLNLVRRRSQYPVRGELRAWRCANTYLIQFHGERLRACVPRVLATPSCAPDTTLTMRYKTYGPHPTFRKLLRPLNYLVAWRDGQ